MKNQRQHARHTFGLILTLVGLICGVIFMPGSARLASAQAVVYPNWRYTGNLNVDRSSYTATVLQNGKVLIVGGYGNCSFRCTTHNTAELYDPTTGTWSSTGNLSTPRAVHTATLLPNGNVLVVGGEFNFPNSSGSFLKSTELYDPATGTWSSTGNLNTARAGHTATLLPNGKVLVAGSFNNCLGLSCLNLKNAELYDPASGTWSNTGNLNTGRGGHKAIMLPNGKVLVAGGYSIPDCPDHCYVLNSAELYDPSTGAWSNTGNLNTGRGGHTATLLANGKVLIAGGLDGIYITSSAELYDPSTGAWTNTGNLGAARFVHAATLLLNGKVLVAGGAYGYLNPFDIAELYDPTTGRWTITAYPNTDRSGHSATLLPNGNVLVTGGFSVSTAELYNPGTEPNSNIIDDAKFFVQQHYFDFLQRKSDADGLAFWTNQITSCGADAQCLELKRINVSAAFFVSIEFQETGYFVYRVNKAAHGNLSGLPIPLTLNTFQGQVLQVGNGVVVGQPGWEQVLEMNKQLLLGELDGETDYFTSAYPTSMSPAEFVDTLFANAEVTPSASDRTAAINEFGSATTSSDLVTRARVLRRVAENSTLKQQDFNRAFVLMQYFGYLRRNPNDAPEPTLDFQGYNFWLNKLNQFNGNFINAEMVKSFIVSGEYRQRFGP